MAEVRGSDAFAAAQLPGSNAKEHRTVSRVAAILEAAAATPRGLTLTTLSDDLDAPKSSVHGLLKGLVAIGYLAERNGHYVLGPAVDALFAPAARPSLAEVAQDAMAWLHGQFNETVILGTRVGESIVYLHTMESSQLIKYSAPLHTRRPVFPTSMGKIYLAELPSRRLERYLTTRVTAKKKRSALIAEIEAIRRSGVAFNHNETVPGVFGAASGVRQRGQLVACLSVAGPIERLQPQEDRVSKAVRAAAEQVTSSLP